MQLSLQRRVVYVEERRKDLPMPEGRDPLVIRITGGLPGEPQHAQKAPAAGPMLCWSASGTKRWRRSTGRCASRAMGGAGNVRAVMATPHVNLNRFRSADCAARPHSRGTATTMDTHPAATYRFAKKLPTYVIQANIVKRGDTE
jgi:hypothetical protein